MVASLKDPLFSSCNSQTSEEKDVVDERTFSNPVVEDRKNEKQDVVKKTLKKRQAWWESDMHPFSLVRGQMDPSYIINQRELQFIQLLLWRLSVVLNHVY